MKEGRKKGKGKKAFSCDVNVLFLWNSKSWFDLLHLSALSTTLLLKAFQRTSWVKGLNTPITAEPNRNTACFFSTLAITKLKKWAFIKTQTDVSWKKISINLQHLVKSERSSHNESGSKNFTQGFLTSTPQTLKGSLNNLHRPIQVGVCACLTCVSQFLSVIAVMAPQALQCSSSSASSSFYTPLPLQIPGLTYRKTAASFWQSSLYPSLSVTH